MVDEPRLEWNTAQVRDGTLTVKVAGEFDEEWEQTFARTLALLSSSGTRGALAFTKGKVTVDDVQEGSEENVRFALNGAVQEANAHHSDHADESDEDSGEDDGESEGGEIDRRMTDRFRDPAD
jgi:hypothetical protein